MNPLSVHDAAVLLHRGGLLAYPTEAVWGLGCDPFNGDTVLHLFALKQRAVNKGLILVAGDVGQFDGLLDWQSLPHDRARCVLDSSGPHTWIVPATARVPRWIKGAHEGVAVRVSTHPVVVALCAGFGGPLVSTSANGAGKPPAREIVDFDPHLLAQLDGVMDGNADGLAQPTPIRDALTGAVLRN